ncbi:MAG: hypothetical protein K1X78_15605 [Verrucomicrobiaceae bacterium]|nr:hypothetical protein [Verrucomicrobiaceae bacterium]
MSFTTWYEPILYIAALVAFAFGCRSFENRFVAKLGLIALLAASYVGGMFVSGGSHRVGATAVLMWFLLPWLEIVGRVRKLRFPIKSEVKHRFPPSRELFPDLDALSGEAEQAGFEEIEDTGWQWDETDHFMRLFYHKEKRLQAAISLAQQGDYAFSYVSLTSRTHDGLTITTSNYPFSFTMKFAPVQLVNRYAGAESMDDLMRSHEAFLERHHILNDELAEQDTARLPGYLERDMISQINHNISVRIIEPVGNGLFRYSWRGCIFLWLQVVKDMIRV